MDSPKSTGSIKTSWKTRLAEDDLERAKAEAHTFSKKVEAERERLEEVTTELEFLKREAYAFKRKMRGASVAVKENDYRMAQQSHIVEARVLEATQTYMKRVGMNAKTREAVNVVRRELLVMRGENELLDEEIKVLTEESKVMAKDVEKAEIQTEKVHIEMADIKDAAARDMGELEETWKQLGKAAATPHKREDPSASLKFPAARKASTVKAPAMDRKGRLSIQDEAKIRLKMLRQRVGTAAMKATVEDAVERVKVIRSTVEKILSSLGMKSLDQFIETYSDLEYQNYSLLQHINALEVDRNHLERRVAAAEGRVETEAAFQARRQDTRKGDYTGLVKLLAAAEERYTWYKGKVLSTQEMVSVISEGMERVLLSVAPASRRGLHGEQPEEIHVHNLTKYLAVLEHSVTRLFRMAAELEVANGTSALHDATPRPGSPEERRLRGSSSRNLTRTIPSSPRDHRIGPKTRPLLLKTKMKIDAPHVHHPDKTIGLPDEEHDDDRKPLSIEQLRKTATHLSNAMSTFPSLKLRKGSRGGRSMGSNNSSPKDESSGMNPSATAAPRVHKKKGMSKSKTTGALPRRH